MMLPNWDLLLSEAALASVMPGEYARFAAPVRSALVVFLSGLPPADQQALLGQQMRLPPDATASERLTALAQGSPVLQKLGQVLARDRRLAPALRTQLSRLESLAPSVSWKTIEQAVQSELGPLDRQRITLVPPALAEASVAVVVPYRQRAARTPSALGFSGEMACGELHGVNHGVLKVLKPGIEQRLLRELELLADVGQHLDRIGGAHDIPALDYEESFQQVRSKLREEIALEHEQQHLAEAQVLFSDEPQVQIPHLRESLCTSRITAMERISGGKVTDHGLQREQERHALARLITRTLIAKPAFSHSDATMFHGDPHAGNLFLTEDGRLAILDWSLVGRLSASQREAVVQIMLGAVTLDAPRIANVLAQLHRQSWVSGTRLLGIAEKHLRRIRCGQFPGPSWLMGLLDESVQSAGLRVASDLMVFRKSLHTLEGVIRDVGGSDGVLDAVLLGEFLKQFLAEWPGRWAQAPSSRALPTRLSNLDLAQTVLSGPATVLRFWAGHVGDLLKTCQAEFCPRHRLACFS